MDPPRRQRNLKHETQSLLLQLHQGAYTWGRTESLYLRIRISCSPLVLAHARPLGPFFLCCLPEMSLCCCPTVSGLFPYLPFFSLLTLKSQIILQGHWPQIPGPCTVRARQEKGKSEPLCQLPFADEDTELHKAEVSSLRGGEPFQQGSETLENPSLPCLTDAFGILH